MQNHLISAYRKQAIIESMGEYNITKITQGLFVSDQQAAQDIPFLLGNKVVGVLGWVAQPHQFSVENEDLQQTILKKDHFQVRLPCFESVEEAFARFACFEDELLCGLIYSQSQLEASIICTMYLMRKYLWDYRTALDFIASKIDLLQGSEETIIGLYQYQQNLANRSATKLASIQWNFDFLSNYQSRNEDELLLITSFKNKLGHPIATDLQKGKRKAKERRIKWQDLLRPSSPFSITSAKYIAKSAILKGRLGSPNACISMIAPARQEVSITKQKEPIKCKQLELLYQAVGYNSSPLNNKFSDKQNTWNEFQNGLQLEAMSRAHFYNRHQSGKIKRRGSLKPKTAQIKKCTSTAGNNYQALVGIYGTKQGKGLSRASSAQSFLTGLRSFNKGCMGQ